MKKGAFTILTAALLAGGCTFVEPTEEAQSVRVAYLSQVKECKKLARTTVSVLDKIAIFDRSEEAMHDELEILARNSAAELKGDTVVAMSKINHGEQAFDVYRCKP